jgi:hypothetical protein
MFVNQPVGTASAPQTIMLRNDSTSPVIISNLAISGTNASDFAENDNCVGSVAAGASCSINVTFTPAASGGRTGSLTIANNLTGSPLAVPLSGAGVTATEIASLSASSLTFASQMIGTTSAPQAVTLSNTGNEPLLISNLAASGTNGTIATEFAETDNCDGSVSAGANCTINVTFAPKATGYRTGALTITDIATSPPSPQTVALTGTGISAPIVSLSSTSVAFTAQSIGTTSAAQTVTLLNVGTAILNIQTVGLAGSNPSDFAIATGSTCTNGAAVGPSSSCVIQLTFTPTALGTRSAILGITDNASGSPQTVMLSGIATPEGFLFVPMTPCRVADTRNPAGPFGGPVLSSDSSRSFPIPSSACGIPSNAAAYALNVTVVPSGSLGFISMWPTGQAQPLISTLNSLDGRVKANAAIVSAGTGGAVSVFATNTTNVILDINGYFVPTTVSTALTFYPVTPCRVADTRNATGALGGPSLVGGQVRSFPVLSACSIPPGAQAYSLNFTAIPQGTLGYLSVWPAEQTQPLVSTLNALTGTITANAAIVPAGAGGAVDLFVTDNADMVIDINGYFAPPGAGGLSLYTLTPCRVLDSRENGAPFSGTINVNVMGSGCGVPASAQAYVFNATVVPPSSLGYLTLWPAGAAQPLVSTLNAIDGSLTSNMAIVPAASGAVSAYASNPTQLILDISGYFAP